MHADMHVYIPARVHVHVHVLIEQVSSGIEARYSEYWLRACFQEYAQQIHCELVRGSAALDMRRHADGSPSTEMLMLCLEQLRSGSSISEKELTFMLSGVLAFCADEERLALLLSLLPASSPLGALSSLAGALFHPSQQVPPPPPPPPPQPPRPLLSSRELKAR